jgi:hypothetical protein
MTGTENGDSTGKSIVCSRVLRNKIGDWYNETFIHILEGSHQLVAVSGHGKRNSWKQGVFVDQGRSGHPRRSEETFGV